MTPSIWIVVLNYNGLEDTRKCLRSLANVSYSGQSVLFVDNASSDQPAAAIRAEFPWCHVVVNDDNLGFAGGCNRGVEYTLEHGADWVMLLNNDTIVAPELLDRLAAAATAHPEYQIIGPVINFMDEPDVLMTDGVTFNPPDFHGFFLRKPVPVVNQNPPSITSVDVVNGCCMMISAPVFGKIGLIDEQFFMYHEETDFCLRARNAGFACGVIGNLLVWHKGSSTSKRLDKSLPRYYDARNLLLLLRKHHGARQHGRRVSATAGMYLRYVYYRYCVEREAGHPQSAEAIIAGLCDGMAGRSGRFMARRRLSAAPVRWLFEIGRKRPSWLAHWSAS